MSSGTAPLADVGLMNQAVELAREAGAFTLEHFRTRELTVDTKVDGTPVTAADRGAEALLRERFAAHFPDDGVYGEEQDETIGTSGRRWIIDPIDGTKAFTHGVPLYTNLLALEDAHGIAIGVINVPALGETIYAGRGLGAWCNGEAIHVNDTGRIDGAYLMTSGFGAWNGSIVDACDEHGVHLRTWGDAYGYTLVATGRAEAMADATAELYDLAPVPVIMAEAGGRFTDLDGGPGPGSGSGLATNGHLHDDLLELLRPARVRTGPSS